MKDELEKMFSHTCFDCGNCQYHSEGDSYCELTFNFVFEDWCATDYFYECGGKRWIKKIGGK